MGEPHAARPFPPTPTSDRSTRVLQFAIAAITLLVAVMLGLSP